MRFVMTHRERDRTVTFSPRPTQKARIPATIGHVEEKQKNGDPLDDSAAQLVIQHHPVVSVPAADGLHTIAQLAACNMFGRFRRIRDTDDGKRKSFSALDLGRVDAGRGGLFVCCR